MDTKSQTNDYIIDMKNIQEIFLDFLEENEKENNSHFINIFMEKSKIREDKHRLKMLLYLISKIADNHHRTDIFFNKIEHILKILQIEIQKYFSNACIFNIFKHNKRIILFLLEQKILIPDHFVFNTLSSKNYQKLNYIEYFYPEIKTFLDSLICEDIESKNPEITDIETFNKKRKIGENDNYICQLVRNDSIDEFVSYVNKNNISLSTIIETSIYETNSYLMKHQTTLIEYATFYGSIQIFNYLRFSKVDLKTSLWLQVIHSKNAEIIHLLEENHLELENDSIEYLYIESIKCHHIDIMNYFKNNLNQKEKENIYKFCYNDLKYFNFIDLNDNNFPNDKINVNYMFYDLCKFDYFEIVEIILKNKGMKNINSTKIAIINI